MNQNKISEPIIFELDKQYSTTRCITKAQPDIVNKPEYKINSTLFLPESSNRKAEGGLRTQGYFKRNTTDKPLISIITVVFNGEKFLENTIQSVIYQSYDNVEYIIIDGGSTDSTLEIIKKYDSQIDYWVSERDEGIYNAMNKGVSLATGKWLNFMNAGDNFFNHYIVYSIFINNINADLIYGDHEIRYSTISKSVKAKSNLEIFKGMIFCHQSMFVSRVLQMKNPYQYNKYKIASDFYFIFNYMISNKINSYYTGNVISSVNAKGESNKNIFKTIRECREIVLNKVNFNWIKIYYVLRFFDALIRESIKFILPENIIDFFRKKT